jgi:nucleotide-binding universal stress UspA family protein
MNIRTILFPTDFSSCNEAALKLASTLAAESQALVYVAYVHDIQHLSASMGEAAYLYESQWKEELTSAQSQLSQVLPTVPAVNYRHVLLSGSPVPELLQFADEHDVDLIVMGSHGRSGLSRLILGSVAEGVMRKAKCPVLVVKQPSPEQLAESRVGPVEASSVFDE